jgi:mRNA-degrading endonuclease RelE of RelBE toxin-antitoxin system
VSTVGFEVIFTAMAKATLGELSRAEPVAAVEMIEAVLTHQPVQQSKSRIKRLREFRVPQFRLRVEHMRVYYSVDGPTVTVHAVVTKESATQWMAESGGK